MKRAVFLIVSSLLTIAAAVVRSEETTGIVFVTASPAGTCDIDDSIRGPSPLVARVPPGEHTVTCRNVVEGATVVRSAKAIVLAGKATKVILEMKVMP